MTKAGKAVKVLKAVKALFKTLFVEGPDQFVKHYTYFHGLPFNKLVLLFSKKIHFL